jgi:hypothetical protein
LINENGSVISPETIPQLFDQMANLLGCFDIAGEKNKTQRLAFAKKATLLWA